MSERTPGIRPRPSLGRRLDIAFRVSFPAVSTALALLLTAAPLRLPGQSELQGALALGMVFFWSLHRPESMPPLAVFALGLLADLLDFGPVGVQVLVLLITYGLAFSWRLALPRHGFVGVWMAFLAVAVGAAALQWALTALLAWQVLPAAPALFQATLSAGLYPLLALPLARAHATLAEPERA